MTLVFVLFIRMCFFFLYLQTVVYTEKHVQNVSLQQDWVAIVYLTVAICWCPPLPLPGILSAHFCALISLLHTDKFIPIILLL